VLAGLVATAVVVLLGSTGANSSSGPTRKTLMIAYWELLDTGFTKLKTIYEEGPGALFFL
jgi:hypothetical protein